MHAHLSSLPAGVWCAGSLPASVHRVAPSGHALLNAELPGGGWPLGALIDLVTASDATPWSALLAPALGAQATARRGVIACIQPPHEPYLPALAVAGLTPERLWWLCADTPSDRLWLAEQALNCAGVAAVMAWLPRARAADLRRLHWAAARRAEVLFFVFRPGAEVAAACAPLCLALEGVRAPRGAPVRLRVDVLKRRGPPLLAPLELPAFHPALEALLAQDEPGVPEKFATAAVLPFPQHVPHVVKRRDHALDRLAVAI